MTKREKTVTRLRAIEGGEAAEGEEATEGEGGTEGEGATEGRGLSHPAFLLHYLKPKVDPQVGEGESADELDGRITVSAPHNEKHRQHLQVGHQRHLNFGSKTMADQLPQIS